MMKKESWAKNFFTKSTITWICVILGLFFLIMAAYLMGLVTSFYQNIMVTIGINMILAVGLNLVVGYAGQFSLGHAGFMAIGAYVGAILSTQIPGPIGFYAGMAAGAGRTGFNRFMCKNHIYQRHPGNPVYSAGTQSVPAEV